MSPATITTKSQTFRVRPGDWQRLIFALGSVLHGVKCILIGVDSSAHKRGFSVLNLETE